MPILQTTETGSGRIRAYPAVPSDQRSDAVASSLITAHQRDAGVWIRRARACRQLEPDHLASHLILKPDVRKILLTWATSSRLGLTCADAWRRRGCSQVKRAVPTFVLAA